MERRRDGALTTLKKSFGESGRAGAGRARTPQVGPGAWSVGDGLHAGMRGKGSKGVLPPSRVALRERPPSPAPASLSQRPALSIHATHRLLASRTAVVTAGSEVNWCTGKRGGMVDEKKR